jgi:hypothetical protein
MAPDNQSPASPTPEPALLALARKKFGALSDAEEELFRAAQEGRPASALAADEKENNPADAANWNADRIVRAKCISWVCTDKQASALASHNGLELQGMRIDGELNLNNAEVKFPFVAWKCAFSENISLQDAQLRGLHLLGCQIKSLNADRAIINRSLILRRGFKAEGELNLRRIKIDGDLDCDGAHFSNERGVALSADTAKIGGNVFLRGGFKAEGELNLRRIKIDGDLDCDGAHFSNEGGVALSADAAKIGGNVFLRGGFKAEGEINLVRATIDGNLEGDSAHFSNAKGWALIADGARIDGSFFLRDGFKAEGEVNMVGAKIGGQLDCSGAQFLNEKDVALTARTANIEGGVYLCGGFKAEGRVVLDGATIGNLQILGILESKSMILDLRLATVEAFWDDAGSWPEADHLLIDGFRYERLYEEAPFEADSRKKWLRLQPRHRFWPQPYEQLAVLGQMGHDPEARQIMIEKNRERARFTEFPHQSWWWYNVFGRLIDYGYAPWRAFAMSVAMILLGALLFHVGSTHDLISPTSENAYAKEPNGQVKISEKYPVFNAFFYSLESFTPLLKLDQSAQWRPNANHGAAIPLFRFWAPRSGELLRYYLYVHIAAGWLLTSLWVGAITGLVKT